MHPAEPLLQGGQSAPDGHSVKQACLRVTSVFWLVVLVPVLVRRKALLNSFLQTKYLQQLPEPSLTFPGIIPELPCSLLFASC